MTFVAVPLRTRAFEKFEQGHPDECWLWNASLRGGYGQIRDGRAVRGAHVVVYELLVGEVPQGQVLDHLCRNTACVNPGHLEPVSQGENVRRGDGPTAVNARKQLCDKGHPLTAGPAGVRWCRPCRLEYMAAWRARVGAGV